MSAVGLPSLPLCLTTDHKRSVWEFTSDIRGYLETGKTHNFVRYCPESYRTDGFVPPNLNFRNCFLHRNTTPMTRGGPSLKKLISDSSEAPSSVVLGVIVLKPRLYHVIERHSVKGPVSSFHVLRRKPFFETFQSLTGGVGNSVFICSSMVEGLIKSTLHQPDKVNIVKYGNKAYERLFKSEIGHSAAGCCHVVRVIVKPSTHALATEELVTSYPTTCFLSSPSVL